MTTSAKPVTVTLKNHLSVSKSRKVADPSLFLSSDPDLWEKAYQQAIDPKYAKNTRHWNQALQGQKSSQGDPPIYIIPRLRAAPSYRKYMLVGADADDLHYACI